MPEILRSHERQLMTLCYLSAGPRVLLPQAPGPPAHGLSGPRSPAELSLPGGRPDLLAEGRGEAARGGGG